MYDKLISFLSRYFKKSTIFKVLFNLSPMYRRSSGRVKSVSEDLLRVEVKIPLTYKNRNYVGTIFGGSLFAATDPIYMIQLIQVLGKDYVVWDKETTIRFKRPANETAYAVFEFTKEEIEDMKKAVAVDKEMNVVKLLRITNKHQRVFAEAEKVIYVADKSHYKEKRRAISTSV